jgi:hypothetical protein
MSNLEDDQPFIPAKSKKISALVRNAIKAQEIALVREAELARKAEEREAEEREAEERDVQEREAEEREAQEREVKSQLQTKSSTHSSVKPPNVVQASSSIKAKPMSTPDTKRGTGPAPLLFTTSRIPTGRTCPGCYHCNWTGVSVDNYGCALTYYGSQ